MRLVFFEIEDWERDILIKGLDNYELDFYKEPLNDSFDIAKIKTAEIVSTFIYSELNSKIFDSLPSLRFVSTRSTGFDHIDLAATNKKDIVVSNVPSYGENTVAEHTFALILALSRKIVPSVENTKNGIFDQSGLQGFDLKNKTIGIVGTGKIGAHVARMAYGFEMNIMGYDPFPNMELQRRFSVEYLGLDDLLANADIITLHMPLNDKTKHILDGEAFSKAKSGAYIINTSRGGLIETTALVKALGEGRIAGAALDVLEEEAVIREELEVLSPNFPKENLLINSANNILLKNDRVIVTPHNAFNSKEALERILETTIENIKAFLENQPKNLVKV